MTVLCMLSEPAPTFTGTENNPHRQVTLNTRTPLPHAAPLEQREPRGTGAPLAGCEAARSGGPGLSRGADGPGKSRLVTGLWRRKEGSSTHLLLLRPRRAHRLRAGPAVLAQAPRGLPQGVCTARGFVSAGCAGRTGCASPRCGLCGEQNAATPSCQAEDTGGRHRPRGQLTVLLLYPNDRSVLSLLIHLDRRAETQPLQAVRAAHSWTGKSPFSTQSTPTHHFLLLL